MHTHKKRRVEAASANEDSAEFQKNMYTSYIKSALEALDNVSVESPRCWFLLCPILFPRVWAPQTISPPFFELKY